MLTKLLAQGGRISQRELQERTQISAAALSEVLTRLEDEGLIERTRSIQDRRQLDVMLTQFGKEQALLSAQKMLNFQQWALAPLNEDERLLLANLLEKVAQHWRAQDKIMKEASCKN